MGTFLSCFTRPSPIAVSESTPISHPYPLAARSQMMAEVQSQPHHAPNPRRLSAHTSAPSTPTFSQAPHAHRHPSPHRHRSTSQASSSSHPHPHRPPHIPLRVHEIPFPLLSHPVAVPGSSGPSSTHGSPVRRPTGLPMESAAELLPVPPAVGEAGNGMEGFIGKRGGKGSWADRRRLKKVQIVERDWELWRAEDWGGHSGDSRGEGGMNKTRET